MTDKSKQAHEHDGHGYDDAEYPTRKAQTHTYDKNGICVHCHEPKTPMGLEIGSIHGPVAVIPSTATHNKARQRANASFIVRACNRDHVFEELLEACKFSYKMVNARQDEDALKEISQRMRKAITKAESQ